MPEILASHENSGGYSKYWRLMKILAWRMPEILVSHENSGGYQSWALAHFLKVRYPLPTQFFPLDR
jgi:hypothetical protein